MTDEATSPNTEIVEETTEKTNSVPYVRFKEVNDKFKALEQTVAEMVASQNAVNEKELIEQNKYKELYDKSLADLEAYKLEVEPAVSSKDKHDTWLLGEKTKLLEQLAEDKRELFNGLELEQLRAVVSEANKGTPGVNHSPDVKTQTKKYGGYSSYIEFAQKDPKGYVDAKAAGLVKV